MILLLLLLSWVLLSLPVSLVLARVMASGAELRPPEQAVLAPWHDQVVAA